MDIEIPNADQSLIFLYLIQNLGTIVGGVYDRLFVLEGR